MFYGALNPPLDSNYATVTLELKKNKKIWEHVFCV